MPAARQSPFRIELREVLRLGAPLAAANLLQMAVYAIDVVFIARLGQEALAASSLAMAIFGLIVFGLQGLTGAVAPLIAAERGRKRHAVREIRRSVRMALWLSVGCGLLGMAACLAAEPLLRATGQDPALADRAGGFIALISLATIPMIVSNVLRTFVSAMGRPVIATAVTALALAVNALGNWAFVFGNLGAPPLGLAGSALSSVVTAVATVGAYVALIYSDRNLRRYRIFGRWWRPEWQRLGEIVRIGVPITLMIVAEGGLFSAAAFLMGLIGEAELAGHTLALQIAAIFFQVPFGIGQAATIRVGYHYGAGDRDAVGRAGWAAIVSCLGFQLAAAAAMLLAPRLLLSAYIEVGAAANLVLTAFAVQYLMVAAAFQLVDGMQAVAAGALRGLQDTRAPMAIALFSYWVPGFGAAVLLGFFTPWQGMGVWIGLAMGLVFAAVLLVWRWHLRERLRLVPSAACSD